MFYFATLQNNVEHHKRTSEVTFWFDQMITVSTNITDFFNFKPIKYILNWNPSDFNCILFHVSCLHSFIKASAVKKMLNVFNDVPIVVSIKK